MIRKADKNDLEELANLAVLMWKESSINELIAEFSDDISKSESCLLLKFENDTLIGFAQCKLRNDYVEGTKTNPVGYLEGIFIKEGYRNNGYAKELLNECEAWAKNNGCKEFASDCEIDNITSFQFHKSMGFTETNRIICFAKKV